MPQRTPIPNTHKHLCIGTQCWQILILLGMLVVSPGFSAVIGLDTPVPSLSDPNLADVQISMNFDQTDIRTVIQTIGDITGINFAMDESVRGNVSVISPTNIPLSDAYRVLERVLDLHGFTAIPSGGLVKVIPKKDAVKHNLPVHIGVDPSEIPLNDTLVTQIMPLAYSSAAEVHGVIRDLLAADTKVSVYERTNAIVMTDTSARIHYVAKLIQPLDVPSPGDKVMVFPLEHASAQSLSERLSRILTKSGASPARGARNNTPMPSAAFAARILPDNRINAVVAIGTSHQLQMLNELVTQLDVPRRAGSENANVIYLRNAQAKDVAESLTAAVADMRISGGAVDAGPTLQVTADEGTNSLIITGDAPDFEMINTIVSKLDIVREQVLVEMLIVEVTQEKLLEIGFDWQTLNETADGINGFAGTNFGPRVDFVGGNLEGLAVGAYKGAITDSTSIAAILSLLENDSDVNLLSQPHITTQNHTKAKIIVAENRAFVTDSRIPGQQDAVDSTLVTSYEYRDVGITMEITPHVNQGENVRLEITSEISKLLKDITIAENVTTPTTAKRQAETIVTMQSGDTVVIGGLIRDDIEKVVKKVPLLGDIPGLGYLFRHTSDKTQKTNLLMFITAHVMDTPEEFQAITQEKSIVMPDMIDKAWHRNNSPLPGER